MKLRYFIPLFAFLIPTWIITYIRWPALFREHPEQNMESIIGMLIMWFFMALNYYLGIRSVVKDRE